MQNEAKPTFPVAAPPAEKIDLKVSWSKIVLIESLLGLLASGIVGAISVGDGVVGDTAPGGFIYGLVIGAPLLFACLFLRSAGIGLVVVTLVSAAASISTYVLVTDDASTAGIGVVTFPPLIACALVVTAMLGKLAEQ